ncbi:hypothetical protein MJO29_009528 [Puccinia striiformis f. sp. tritici]|uniref:uncharacterized protein n=1 Tax=Puccinia striiformis f. sp. tritici TaxID=168172 RepID=UPI0020072367|nr:uncharacterized protein Pst134EA_032650 [Puccinia striiformis f. sp. tritici]KAH9440809.1 hypothetical protein Pst134EA_032650 [Puccinia striiformis f. sp. tritici]KAI7950854.1 hypothetical protein MJO29_009528 [Puccinia striiformis f. sp. tritici]KAI9607410.1 hypothetical protein H4Q26_005930 [Puccinia striiformis f. sp. tritici PST-130]
MRHADEFSARVLVNGKVDSRLKVPESKEDVASVIETAKTLFMDGRKRVIYDDILTVDLSGPELPMLTLVDLPGYIQTRALDQPETIVQDIEKLVQKYLAESRTIILAVVPVNRDFGTNAAIKHIQQFDGQGKRTLCVLTKPDLLDRGTESGVFAILSGEKMRLSLGYHVIKNKSFEDCQAS